MKKSIFPKLFIVSTLLLAPVFNIATYAQDPSDLDSLLNDVMNSVWEWWYTTTDRITVKNITTTSITVESPVVKDADGNDIKIYDVTYSNMPMDEVDNPQFKFEKKTITITSTDISNKKFTVDLTVAANNLVAGNIYYVNMIPSGAGPNTHDVCFKLSEELSWEDNYCTENEASASHSAAGANMNLANVTVTHNPSTHLTTVKWISLEWSSNITVYELVESDGTWNKLGTASMSSERFEYTTSAQGEHTVRLSPDNGWTEYVQTYTIKVAGTTPIVNPWVPKVPVVWPEENMMAIWFLTLVWYLVYRAVRKAKH